jgi:hypothetical protein
MVGRFSSSLQGNQVERCLITALIGGYRNIIGWRDVGTARNFADRLCVTAKVSAESKALENGSTCLAPQDGFQQLAPTHCIPASVANLNATMRIVIPHGKGWRVGRSPE